MLRCSLFRLFQLFFLFSCPDFLGRTLCRFGLGCGLLGLFQFFGCGLPRFLRLFFFRGRACLLCGLSFSSLLFSLIRDLFLDLFRCNISGFTGLQQFSELFLILRDDAAFRQAGKITLLLPGRAFFDVDRL